jgi:hypothetical protein
VSTKPIFRPGLGPGIAAALGILIAGCAASPPEHPLGHFSEVRLGPPPPGPPTAPELRPRVAAPAPPSPVLPVTLDGATSRVAAYLQGQGFALEQRPDGPGRLLAATRMGRPAVIEPEAVCGLEAMHRPDFSSTDLTVRLLPAPGGVQVEEEARFVEIDTRIIAGTLARQTCRSRGVLEAAVRRAALGG